MCFYGTAAERTAGGRSPPSPPTGAVRRHPCLLLRRQPRPQRRGPAAGGDAMPGLRFFWDFDGKVAPALRRDLAATPSQPQAAGDAPLLGGDRPHHAGQAGGAVPAGRRRVPALIELPPQLPAPDEFAGIEVPAPGPHPAQRVRAGALPAADRPLRAARRRGIRLHARGRRARPSTIQDHKHKRRDYADRGPGADQADRRCASMRRIVPGDPEGAPVPGDPHGALYGRLLRGRGRRPFPRPPRQHHQGHGAPPVRGHDQPQRRIRGRRDELPRIRPAQLQAADRRRGRVLLLAAARGLDGDQGSRYAFLPFLYDDAAAKMREANNEFLGEGVGAYKA